MNRRRTPLALLCAALCASGGLAAQERAVREADLLYAKPIDELLRIETEVKADVGSRSGERPALDAAVPIDVITAAQLEASGQTELGRVLSRLLPGYNQPRPSIADGTDHAPPFTLRGLNPDQVLVLVNGKRRHQGALLHNNGTIGRGSSGVDLATLPLRAIERIEVLRDGAAAQYGSDAIAGIINIILKGYGHESQAAVSVGRTRAGDGLQRQTDVFLTRALPGDGFLNLTAELRDRAPTNRAQPDVRDGGRINTHFGDPDTQDGLFALNLEVPGEHATWYAHATANERRSSAGAFFRLRDDDRNLPALYPNGFLPLIEPRIRDRSVATGVRGVLDTGTKWDFSVSHGENDYRFFLRDTLNRSLGLATPTTFDSGANRYAQTLLNLDLGHRFGRHHLAGGLEYRRERYRIVPGEEASWALGPDHDWAAGAQGFGGFMPENAVDARRRAVAAYLDAKFALAGWLTLDAATRAEHYSDFGGTLDGKLALRARPSEDLLLRASTSSGFRAPSLSQANFSSTGMYLSGEEILRFGNYGVDHPVARALGARPLNPESSIHHTLGFVFQPASDLSFSADYFVTRIDDRILPTGYIDRWNSALSPAVYEILNRHGVDGAIYFTNAIATRTRGFDLRAEHLRTLPGGDRLRLSAAYHRSATRITGVNSADPVLGMSYEDLILDANTRVTIEEGQPRDALRLWGKYEAARFDVVAALNRYGAYASTSGFDRIRFAPRWTVDAEFAWRPARDLTLAFGVENLFNTRPAEWGVLGDAIHGSDRIIRYSQYAPFGYNGAFYYLRLALRF